LGDTVPMVLDARVCGRVRTLPKLRGKGPRETGAFLLLGCGVWVVGCGWRMETHGG
jgi:hypothetical protein